MASTFIPSRFIRITLALTLLFSINSQADTLNVAVASNFLSTAQTLKVHFEQSTEHSVKIISASTGQLSHQIANGAPFDVFLAANKQHPTALQQQLNLPAHYLFQYAQGALVLVSHKSIDVVPNLRPSLKNLATAYTENQSSLINSVLNFSNKVAIANQKLAPYGRATVEVLASLKLLNTIKHKVITGQNIAQTHQFFSSKNVDSAFIARSQITESAYTNQSDQNSFKTIIPIASHLHQPIEQWGLVVRGTPASEAFHNFLSQPQAIHIIKTSGYSAPSLSLIP